MEIIELGIKIRLLEKLLGTVPKDKEIYTNFVLSKAPDKDLAEAESVQQIEEKGWTGFHQDENGLFLFDYLVKGFLKAAATVLKDTLKIKNLKSKIDSHVFVFPRKIYLNKETPDGVFERPLRAETMQGPRVCLARSDYVKEGVEFEIVIRVIPHKEISPDTIQALLKYGALKGLGQFRNGSFGRFEFEVMKKPSSFVM